MQQKVKIALDNLAATKTFAFAAMTAGTGRPRVLA
jgi:hypothetical protein